MNTHNTVLDNASVEATTPDRILQTTLAAWRQGNFARVVDQFNGQFTFTDGHAAYSPRSLSAGRACLSETAGSRT
jgi:hypothetical protein